MFKLSGEALDAVRGALAARERQRRPPAPQRQPLIGAGESQPWFPYSAVEVIDPEKRFAAPEVTGLPTPFRGSIVRVALFKLIGSGVLAGLTAAGSSEPFSRKSCALAAAVNTVAIAHYAIIWQLRLQSFTQKPFFDWMIGLRNKERDVANEVLENYHKAYVQEWAVTLVLLYLDLHALAERVPNAAAPGAFLEPAFGGIFQVLMIICGSITRFLCNNARPGKGEKDPNKAPERPSMGIVITALFFFLAAVAFFVLPFVNLANMVGNPWDLEGKPYEDAILIYVIMFLQVGYPVISIIEWVVVTCFAQDLRDVYSAEPLAGRRPRPMPGDQYPPLLSLFKDIGYGSLDTLTKGGLAVYVAFRAAR